MAKGQPVTEPEESMSLIPPPVPGGVDHLESLGPFIDRLLGDGRRRRAALKELAPLCLSGDDAPVDPEPVEPPPPLPDGTDTKFRGRRRLHK
jgi:hypothetical protein